MRTKIGVAEFNKHLAELVRCAVDDGLMDVYQIQGSCMAAANFVDRCALAAAQANQAREIATGIIPATTLPPLPPTKKP